MCFKCSINLLLTFILLIKSLEANEYCNVKCDKSGAKHTKCQYDCKPSSANCNGQAKLLANSPEVRKIFLELHNKIRNELASGNIPNHPQAADMMELSYNAELEDIAGCYAATCQRFGAHDKCRNTLDGESAGQNAYYSSWTSSSPKSEQYLDTEEFINEVVTAWKDEYKHTPKDVIQSFRSSPNPNMPHGHWTQQIWSRTTEIGCARVYVVNGNQEKAYVYCNYKTAGNYLNQPVYKQGKQCTECSNGKCSKAYPALCANEKSKMEENKKPDNEEESERQQEREREENLKQEQKRKQEQEERERKEKRKQEEQKREQEQKEKEEKEQEERERKEKQKQEDQKREQEQKRKQEEEKEQEERGTGNEKQEQEQKREREERERREKEWELENKHFQDREKQWKLEREREQERAREREKEFEREREREKEREDERKRERKHAREREREWQRERDYARERERQWERERQREQEILKQVQERKQKKERKKQEYYDEEKIKPSQEQESEEYYSEDDERNTMFSAMFY